MPIINEAQVLHDTLLELDTTIKTAVEAKSKLLQDFYDKYEDYELAVMIDGKEKFIRTYKPEGRFVYNTLLEVGLRVKAQNLFIK